MSALIDFGDARIGAPDYEWMPLWLGLCNRDAALLRSVLEAYDPSLLTDPGLGQRIAAWTLLHDYGSDAIAELFENSGAVRPVAVAGSAAGAGVARSLATAGGQRRTATKNRRRNGYSVTPSARWG